MRGPEGSSSPDEPTGASNSKAKYHGTPTMTNYGQRWPTTTNYAPATIANYGQLQPTMRHDQLWAWCVASLGPPLIWMTRARLSTTAHPLTPRPANAFSPLRQLRHHIRYGQHRRTPLLACVFISILLPYNLSRRTRRQFVTR
jgi:hypothetical protein